MYPLQTPNVLSMLMHACKHPLPLTWQAASKGSRVLLYDACAGEGFATSSSKLNIFLPFISSWWRSIRGGRKAGMRWWQPGQAPGTSAVLPKRFY